MVDTEGIDAGKLVHSNGRVTAAEFEHPDDYVLGANGVGFCEVADAMLDEGVIRGAGAPVAER